MRVLLDENLPVGLIRQIRSHDLQVDHVTRLGWQGKANGDLLRDAVAHDYDVLVTGDVNLPYQQDLQTFDVAVVQLRADRLVLDELLPLMPRLVEAIRGTPRRALAIVSTGRPA